MALYVFSDHGIHRTDDSNTASVGTDRNTIARNNIIRTFSVTRTMKFNLEYINTPISSVPHNQSDIRIAFGYTDMLDDQVRIVEYLGERQFFEVCREAFRNTVYQSQWIPSHPRLLAIATNHISIYEYQDRKLNYRRSYLPEQNHNPVIDMDWNHRDPQIILATRLDGKLALMHMEYGRTCAEMVAKKILPFSLLSEPRCGARFGTGTMEKCIVTLDKNNEIVILDDTFKTINRYKCKKDVLDIQFSKHSEHLVAFRNKNKVCLYDIRYLTREVNIYSSFFSSEVPTCFCWSPYSSTLYIGTSEGGIIKWKTDHTRLVERSTSVEKKPIPNIHVPKTMPNLFFATSVDLPNAPYATCVEAYLN